MGTDEVTLDDNDKWLVLAAREYYPLFNKKIFLKPSPPSGFSFNKETKKLTVWRGASINSLPYFKEFLRVRGLEWVTNEKLAPWLTKGLFERILRGKVTCPSEAYRYIISSMRWPKTTSAEYLRQYIKDGGNKQLILSLSLVAKDMNQVLREEVDSLGRGGTRADVIKQAKILGERIDFSWSDKRLEAEHQRMTKLIMALEVGMLDDYACDYLVDLGLPEGVTVLDTRRKVFEEGTMMRHCIYTNYWTEIQKGHYMAFHCKLGSEEWTVGVDIHQGKLADQKDHPDHPNYFAQIDACHTRYNGSISEHAQQFVDLAFSEFALKNCVSSMLSQSRHFGTTYRDAATRTDPQDLPF